MVIILILCHCFVVLFTAFVLTFIIGYLKSKLNVTESIKTVIQGPSNYTMKLF